MDKFPSCPVKLRSQPVKPGRCKAFLQLGPKWENVVRCSYNATVQGYCRRHAKREGIPLPDLVVRPRRKREPWSQAAILDSIRSYEVDHGKPPTVTVWRAPGDKPSLTAINRHFGSWANAVESAGFPRPCKGHYDRRGLIRGKYKPRRRGLAFWKQKTLEGKLRELDVARLAYLDDPLFAELIADQIEDEMRAHRVKRGAGTSLDTPIFQSDRWTLHDVWTLDPLMPDATFVAPLIEEMDLRREIDLYAELDAIRQNLYTPTL